MTRPSRVQLREGLVIKSLLYRHIQSVDDRIQDRLV